MFNKRAAGFTLIELLTVIAIIGILAGILIPTVTMVKISANRAKTKAQFGQWSVGMGLFKQEYGYYPAIDSSNKLVPAKFSGALTGQNLDGSRPASDLAGNSRGLSFYSISQSEVNEAKTNLIDAFGNIDIAVYVDKDGNGVIDASDGAFVTVKGIYDADAAASSPELPTGGVGAAVIFYSAGKGGGSSEETKKNLVTSW